MRVSSPNQTHGINQQAMNVAQAARRRAAACRPRACCPQLLRGLSLYERLLLVALVLESRATQRSVVVLQVGRPNRGSLLLAWCAQWWRQWR
jgi:hypothetical protein